MAFDDLDLEFEDEDESSSKAQAAASAQIPKPQPLKSSAPGGTTPGMPNPLIKAAEVKKIEEARAKTVAAPAHKSGGTQPQIVGTSALKQEPSYDNESLQMLDMREQMRRVELDAGIKIGVAEFKTEYLTEMLSDMKMVEHQIGQLLIRVNTKHPDVKNEMLMIKKILADFVAKKRK
jgi:hypothetical protein